MMPTVRDVIAASTAFGSRQKLSGEMSTKTGVAPVRATEFPVAAKLNDGTMISSPACTPAASRPMCSADVPELTAGKKLLLFDDLHGSGATVGHIVEVLKSPGRAKAIYLLTLKKTI